MDAEKVLTIEDMRDRRKWLLARKTGLGGSDIAAVLGLSPWRSPFALWQEKINPAVEDEAPDAALAERLHWGTVLEGLVSDEFAARTGKQVRRCGLVRSKKCPWALASVDRLVVGENAGLECKTTAGWNASEWEDDKLPIQYYLQCQWYMMVTGAEKWYIAVLIGGNRFLWKAIERNDDDIAIIVEKAKAFWEENVLQRKLPEVDGSETCTQVLAQMYPGGEKDEMLLSGEVETLVSEIAALTAEAASISDAIEGKKNALRRLMENHEYGSCEGYSVSFKPSITSRLDSKRLKQERPDVYAQYTVSKPSRPLIIKKKQKQGGN